MKRMVDNAPVLEQLSEVEGSLAFKGEVVDRGVYDHNIYIQDQDSGEELQFHLITSSSTPFASFDDLVAFADAHKQAFVCLPVIVWGTPVGYITATNSTTFNVVVARYDSTEQSYVELSFAPSISTGSNPPIEFDDNVTAL